MEFLAHSIKIRVKNKQNIKYCKIPNKKTYLKMLDFGGICNYWITNILFIFISIKNLIGSTHWKGAHITGLLEMGV